MKHLPIDSALFTENRKRFQKAMKPDSIAIFVSNDEYQRNADALHLFEQNSDLYWLTGIMQEDTMLVLFPDNPDVKMREVLVLVRPNEMKEKWDGKRLRAKEATAISGIETVIWLDSLEAALQPWVHLADHIYLDTNENDRKAGWFGTSEYRFVQDMQKKYPLHRYERAAKIMKDLRSLKTAHEVEVVKHIIVY
jgi:Xaa-Pro aminopeptidase